MSEIDPIETITFILKNTNKTFGGFFIVGEENVDFSKAEKTIEIPIIWSNSTKFQNVNDYFESLKIDTTKETIFFMGYGNTNNINNINWNCFIVCKNKIIWYDPLLETEKNINEDLDDYNSEEDSDYEYESLSDISFDSDSSNNNSIPESDYSEISDEDIQEQISNYFEKVIETLEFEKCAQKKKNTSIIWLLIFLTFYVEGNIKNFRNLNFSDIVIKKWKSSILKKLSTKEVIENLLI